MATVDMELKKHFEELQAQLVDTRTKMRQLDGQIENLKRTCQHSTLTKREVSAIPTDVKTYESVGRMFVRREITEVNSMLEDKIKKGEDKIGALEATKKILEKSLKERENNLRELVAAKMMRDLNTKK